MDLIYKRIKSNEIKTVKYIHEYKYFSIHWVKEFPDKGWGCAYFHNSVGKKVVKPTHY